MKILHSLIAGLWSAKSILAQRIVYPLLVGAGLMLAHPCAGQTGTWTATGSLVTGRYNHSATLLPDGKVLVAGGIAVCCDSIASAELYDPASGTWTATGSLANVREQHTATLLPNGKVLVAGGNGDFFYSSLASAELYDPASGTWTGTGSVVTARSTHTATLLPNGEVLVAAGLFLTNPIRSAELYDSASGTWSATGRLVGSGHSGRAQHTATLLPNGEVLVAGGFNPAFINLKSAQLYDPVSGTWTATGRLLGSGRAQHTATLLPEGKVLVAGGYNSAYINLKSAELYDPASETWTATGSLITARDFHTATLLPNGEVLVAGGNNGGNLASAELYTSAGSAIMLEAARRKMEGTIAARLNWREASSTESIFTGMAR